MSRGLSRQQLHILQLAQRNHHRFSIDVLPVNATWSDRAVCVDAAIARGEYEGVPLYAHEIMHKVYGITLRKAAIRRAASDARGNRRWTKRHPEKGRPGLWFYNSFRARLADHYGKYRDDGRRAAASASMSRAMRSLKKMGLAVIFHGDLFLTDAGLRFPVPDTALTMSPMVRTVNTRRNELTESGRRHIVNTPTNSLTINRRRDIVNSSEAEA